ncbi:MAG TPA: diacylglycerol kinase family protein [Chloroflexota bacterium]|nr:diacylglycerol kinase family protein [Chloroflexota bacterium]
MSAPRPSPVTPSSPESGRRQVVLVVSPHAGRARRELPRVRAALDAAGLTVREEIPLSELHRVQPWLALPSAERPLIVAAGGDGTVGSVADLLANGHAVLGILPLGTSNDVARSLDIPLDIRAAARLLANGPVSTVDLGHFRSADGTSRHFVHAAALGLNVAFARIATSATVRRRLGRLTYLVAMATLLRERRAFPCTLALEVWSRRMRRVPEGPLHLVHLSVMNAPIFGGFFDLRLPGSDVDDRRLDVLAIEDVPLSRLVLVAVLIFLRRQPRIGGVHVFHTRRLHVHVDVPVEVSLDGEIIGHVPGDFLLVGEALRVITGPRFIDVDGAESGTP